ncbi:velvet protein [Cadophora gregata f. sp. sojae]|nr:velvet protein [Cadophora gregata f. sp. sojae]
MLHFDWRLEIKSELFTVFSAKKFPGLAESTSLSRTVAEQGCRVRIRRDVRMRRREGKSNGEMEAQEEEYRASRPIEQDSYQARSRSNSAEGYRSGAHSPIAPAVPGAPPGGNLGWVDAQRQQNAPQFAVPGNFAAPAPQQYHPPAPHSHYQQAPPQHSGYGQQPPPTHPGYGEKIYPSSAVEMRRDRDMYEHPEVRRASAASYQPPHPYQHVPAPPVDSSYGRQPYQSYAPSPVIPAQLPPLRQENLEKRHSIAPRPGAIEPSSLAPIRSPTYERNERPIPAPLQYAGTPLAPAPAPLTPATPTEPMRNGIKRPYGSVFSSSATEEPLHNGMRPGSSQGDKTKIDEDEDDIELIGGMVYKRADGTDNQRHLPQMN